MTNLGTIVAPGVIPATHSIPDPTITVLIIYVHPENGYDAEGKPRPSEHQMAGCEYPDGFVKEHQVKEVADLLPKVVNQLRGRYGRASLKITHVPALLKAGEHITLENDNG